MQRDGWIDDKIWYKPRAHHGVDVESYFTHFIAHEPSINLKEPCAGCSSANQSPTSNNWHGSYRDSDARRQLTRCLFCPVACGIKPKDDSQRMVKHSLTGDIVGAAAEVVVDAAAGFPIRLLPLY
ncbi:BQ5605_C011g06629 [Microbotryum silenes-dioicae]|uniref:BQ5605_C011g06513 protein n=1 Tax=Microbotryum silenes-dioicae TaxID=796604 RepID=A0A2X0LPB8_9BASI|nr:BQ5605_C011g06513 [Microbotryum silenes-dioicae]SGY12859.1 BQ5605_C011g06629 [Microbotryum silenes-dioicae]